MYNYGLLKNGYHLCESYKYEGMLRLSYFQGGIMKTLYFHKGYTTLSQFSVN